MAQNNNTFLNILLLRCPRCGKGKIYSGLLKTVKKCSSCKLDIEKHDAGDGPAYCSMFLTATIITIAAVMVENYYRPDMWLHAMLWIPSVIILSVASLIFFKSLFIALQYIYVGGFKKKQK